MHAEAVSLDLTCNALQAPGHRITGTCDTGEALALMKEFEFELVVADLEMHPVNGVELLRRMNRNKIEIPILFVSNPSVISKVITAGMGSDALVERPFNAATLRKRVDRFLTNCHAERSEEKPKAGNGRSALKRAASIPSVRNLFIHRIS
ncbi:MAG TPA: response regulator [Bryobacteraceae bacterium]